MTTDASELRAMTDENPYCDLSFWLQRNWDWWAVQEFYGMYFWTEQCLPGETR